MGNKFSFHISCILLLYRVACIKVSLEPPNNNLPAVNLDGSFQRQKSSLSGGHDTCFLAKLHAGNNKTSFLVQIDTGSSDTLLPYANLNDYRGPTILLDEAISSNDATYSSAFNDGSFWAGTLRYMNITLDGTNITSNAPVLLLTSQSSLPVFASGAKIQGLMGVGFASLSVIPDQYPSTLLDAWAASGTLSKNQIAFHGCPYSHSNANESSYIDIGNDTPYEACNAANQTAVIQIMSKSYYNLNIKSISIAGKSQNLPSDWQKHEWSILDSCTSNIIVPSTVLRSLHSQIHKSNGISKIWRDSKYFTPWLNNQVQLSFLPGDLVWEKLPTLSFEITGHQSTVRLTIGPRQYIQVNARGYYTFLVSSWGDSYAILGVPIFSAYHIIVDRNEGTVQFQLGCDCKHLLSTTGFPAIEII